jgi:hypothetical protein
VRAELGFRNGQAIVRLSNLFSVREALVPPLLAPAVYRAMAEVPGAAN